MFIILVYDVNVKRVAKVLKTCRKYIYWVQNSVFEGEISEAGLKALKTELLRIINLAEDSIIIYNLRTKRYSSRDVIGVKRGSDSFII